MSLKAALANTGPRGPKGFDLPTPPCLRFNSQAQLTAACAKQKEDVTLLDADFIEEMDVDGHVNGVDMRLSKAAFSDLCHVTGVPVSFIRRLAAEDESLALDVIAHSIKSQFHKAKRQLVVDTDARRIDGIVSKGTYTPLDNMDLVEWVLSGGEGLKMTSAWLEGPVLRMTVVDDLEQIEARVGDIVRFGVDVRNAINGDSATHVCDYNERLVCANGMRCTERGAQQHIRHVGDSHELVQQAVNASAERSKLLVPRIQAATEQYLTAPDLRRVKGYIGQPKNGGGPTLENKVVRMAVEESKKEGKGDGEITLWNVVNGVTEAAHDAKSLGRRTEIESLGYAVLARFGVST